MSSQFITFDDLYRFVQASLPGATIEESPDGGELIIFTGLRECGDGVIASTDDRP